MLSYDDFDDEEDPFNYFSNLPRLEGGSTPKESDDLKDLLTLTDEEDDPKKPNAQTKPAAAKAAPEPTPIPPEQQPRSKREKIILVLHYIKIIVIVLCLLFSIVLLAINDVWKNQHLQTSVSPNQQKEFPIHNMPHKHDWLHVTLRGPFLLNDDCTDEPEKKPPMITAYVFQKEGNSEKKLSGDWKICIESADKLDKVKSVSKDKIFQIDEKDEGSPIFIKFVPENLEQSVFVGMTYDAASANQKDGIIYGTLVLIFLYFMIVSEIIDRTFASLIAAALALAVLALCKDKADQNAIINWIDIETLALLVGMMLLVSILAESGIFDYFAVFAYKVAKGRVWPLINCLCFFTAFLAMFLDSVTMMLLATPVTIRLCEVLSLDPVPVLITMVLFANVGAAMTPVGDPPNVIISLNPIIQSNGVNFGSFVLHMFPGVVLALAQSYVHIRLLFRKPESLRPSMSKEEKELLQQINVWKRTAAGISPTSENEDAAREALRDKIERLQEKLTELQKEAPKKESPSFQETLAQLQEQYPLRDKILMAKAGLAFAFVLFLFFAHSVPNFLHVSLGWSALIGAFLLLVISDRRDLESILVRIEWSTLLFFAALFIVMESLSILGVIEIIGRFVVYMISSVEQKYQMALAIFIVVWVSGIASAFLDNIPVTTMMVKIIIKLSEDKTLNLPLSPLVWSLAFGACFGGNGTIIGASANVVTAGVSEQHGYKISFLRFLIVCFPLMLGNLFVATVYLLIAHAAFSWHEPNPKA